MVNINYIKKNHKQIVKINKRILKIKQVIYKYFRHENRNKGKSE